MFFILNNLQHYSLIQMYLASLILVKYDKDSNQNPKSISLRLTKRHQHKYEKYKKEIFHRKFIPPSWRAQVSCIHCQSTSFYLLLLPLQVACLLLVRCKLQLNSYQCNKSHHLSD